jgi:uncharacterized protein (UPF0333 family)
MSIPVIVLFLVVALFPVVVKVGVRMATRNEAKNAVQHQEVSSLMKIVNDRSR